MLKSAHFVFWTRCAASSRNRLLFCPLYWWPGLQMGTADRAAAKKTDTPGLCPVSYGEPRRQLNSHNGKEYLSFPGKYATTPAPSVPREGGRGQKWAQEPIPAAWCERKSYITAFAVKIGAAFCFRAASDQNRKQKFVKEKNKHESKENYCAHPCDGHGPRTADCHSFRHPCGIA